MNSKEALEILFASYNFDGNYHDLIIAREKLEQDLDKLEKLEKENKELRKAVKSWNENCGKLIRENIKCKRALDILVEVVSLNSNRILETERNLLRLSKEEYELLKEVLE